MLNNQLVPKRTPWTILRPLLIVIAMAGIGFVVGSAIGRLLRDDGPRHVWTLPELIAIPFLLVAAFWLVIATHELGHVVAARLVRFRFILFIAGPLKIIRQGERITVGLNRSLALYGGIAGSVPRSNENLRMRMAAMVAGGPLTSLLLALICVPLFPITNDSVLGSLFVTMLCIMSLFIGIATIIPMRSGGFYSDGARLLMLLRGGPEAERWCALGALSGSFLALRPREMSVELLNQAINYPDQSFDHTSALMMCFYAALDRGDTITAGTYLDRMLENIERYPSALRSSLTLEAAYYIARHRGDTDTARMWQRFVPIGTLVEQSTRSRAEAAILLSEGKIAEGHAEAQRGLQSLQRNKSGFALSETDWLEELTTWQPS